MGISNLDRQEWAAHPVTRELLQLLKESKQTTLEDWAKEQFVSEDIHTGALVNARALGGVDTLTQLIEKLEAFAEGEG